MKTFSKIFICALLLLAAFWKFEAISPHVLRARKFIGHQYHIWKSHRHKADLKDLQPLETNANEWYAKYHFIAHNGGGIDGKTGTDSREAWELSYRRGVRIIDADLSLTSDNHLVLRHSWRDDLEQDYFPNVPTLEQFKASLILKKYHPMTIEDMINFMASHDDVYVAADSKFSPAKIYPALVETAKKMNAEEILSRIIVSLYNTEDIDRVKAIYPFKNFALRQYGWQHNWYELTEFCVKNDIHAVNIFDSVIDADPEGVKILASKGIHIFAAVINSLRQLQGYKDLGVTGAVSYLGVTGAVSDYLSEADWGLLK